MFSKFLLSYKSPATEGDWWGAYSIFATSRRQAVKIAKDKYANIMGRHQWRITKEDK